MRTIFLLKMNAGLGLLSLVFPAFLFCRYIWRIRETNNTNFYFWENVDCYPRGSEEDPPYICPPDDTMPVVLPIEILRRFFGDFMGDYFTIPNVTFRTFEDQCEGLTRYFQFARTAVDIYSLIHMNLDPNTAMSFAAHILHIMPILESYISPDTLPQVQGLFADIARISVEIVTYYNHHAIVEGAPDPDAVNGVGVLLKELFRLFGTLYVNLSDQATLQSFNENLSSEVARDIPSLLDTLRPFGQGGVY